MAKSQVRTQIEKIVNDPIFNASTVFVDGYETKNGRRWRMKFGGFRRPFTMEEEEEILKIPGVVRCLYSRKGSSYNNNAYSGPTVIFDERPKGISLLELLLKK